MPDHDASPRGIAGGAAAGNPALIVTLTSDPEFDTPAMLKKYAQHFDADTNRWMFLTGPKPDSAPRGERFQVCRRGKRPDKRESPADPFIHSTWFVLVDKQGRVRGWTDREGSLHASYDSDA